MSTNEPNPEEQLPQTIAILKHSALGLSSQSEIFHFCISEATKAGVLLAPVFSLGNVFFHFLLLKYLVFLASLSRDRFLLCSIFAGHNFTESSFLDKVSTAFLEASWLGGKDIHWNPGKLEQFCHIYLNARSQLSHLFLELLRFS